MAYKHNPELTSRARALRREMTQEERRLWYTFLRGYQPRFLRQKVIDHYIADFYCHATGLVVELDGSQHYEGDGPLRDRVRTQQIAQWGITLLRIPNNEVNRNFRGVCEYIDYVVQKALLEKGGR